LTEPHACAAQSCCVRAVLRHGPALVRPPDNAMASSFKLLPCVLAGALLTLALPSVATEPVPGHSLESVHAWVLEHNPELRALDFETQAAEARILPAGALPDPTASVGFRGLDPETPWRAAG